MYVLEGEEMFGLTENDDAMKGSKEEDLGLLKGQAPVGKDKKIKNKDGLMFGEEH